MSSPINSLESKIFANAFNLIPEVGSVTLTKLLNHFNDWHQAWVAGAHEYFEAGLNHKTISQIIAKKSHIKPEQMFAELARRDIEAVLISEPEYPKLLKEIHAAPPLLYVRGNKSVLNKVSLAVVGTRKISSYGSMAAEEIVSGLVNSSVTIVSGLAFGIDAAALNAAVESDGSSIAVLASDLDNANISPRSNFNLAQKILDKGCLISEYPLGHPSAKQNFPIRNRIIAGLNLGTVVIEADEESGSLITANFALEQNREVFAVPGSIFSQVSRGTNALIKKGAKLVTSAADILDELNLIPQTILEPVNFDATDEEQTILTKLTKEPTHINDLIKSLKLNPSQVNANLTMLEMKGRVKNLGGAKYVKIR
jgi:DNA processing protein